MAGGHTWQYCAPRVSLHVSHRLDSSRSDVVRVGRNDCHAGLATVGPDVEECAHVGGDGASPAVDDGRLFGDDRLWVTSFLCGPSGEVPESFLSTQDGNADPGRHECVGFSPQGVSQGKLGSGADSAASGENYGWPVACVVGDHDHFGTHDPVPSVLVRLQQAAALCDRQSAPGLLTGGA